MYIVLVLGWKNFITLFLAYVSTLETREALEIERQDRSADSD